MVEVIVTVIGYLLDRWWGMLIAALVLLGFQVVCIQYGLSPTWGDAWEASLLLLFVVDTLFVALCDAVLMARRQKIVTVEVAAQATSLSGREQAVSAREQGIAAVEKKTGEAEKKTEDAEKRKMDTMERVEAYVLAAQTEGWTFQYNDVAKQDPKKGVRMIRTKT